MKPVALHSIRWVLIFLSILLPVLCFYHGYTSYNLDAHMNAGGTPSEKLQRVIFSSVGVFPLALALMWLGIGLPVWFSKKDSGEPNLHKMASPVKVIIGAIVISIIMYATLSRLYMF